VKVLLGAPKIGHRKVTRHAADAADGCWSAADEQWAGSQVAGSLAQL